MIWRLFFATLVFPLKGALIRCRANFTPKAQPVSELPSVDVVQRGSQPRSLLGMLKRVNAEEGIDGLYKGILPTLGFILFWEQISTPSVVVVGFFHFGLGEIYASTLLIVAIAYFVKIIATVIEVVFVNRAVTSRENLPSLSLGRALDVLLSPAERRHPYRIFMIPGLLAACTSWALYIVGTIMTRNLLFVKVKLFLEHFGNWEDMKPYIPLLVVAIVLSVVLNALVLTPLEVMIVRLSIQTNSTQVTLLLDTPPDEDEQDYSVKPVRLRTCEEYTGLINCMRLIIQEEGWGALYRGWWWTAFGGILFI